MTGNQIRQLAEMYCGVSIEDDIVVSVINEGLEAIGDLAFLHEEILIEYPAEQKGFYVNLPETTVSILNVVDSDGKIYQEWQTRGTSIKFRGEGSYKVTTQQMPKLIEKPEETPDCHPMFQRALVTYLRGFIKMIKDDSNQDGVRLLNQAMGEIERTGKILQGLRKR